MSVYQHQVDRAEATLERIAATLERNENLLAAILAAVVERQPASPRIQLPPSYGVMQSSGAMMSGPHVHPVNLTGGTLLGYDAQLAAAIPLPPARGTGVFAVEGPNGELPSHIGTPGATNPDVTDDPAALKATIGTPGWTATVRPPVSYTNALKIQVMAEYGLSGDPASFELDHLVPLCAGGNPVSQLNLWAQRREGINGASTKDLTEVAAQHAILSGAMSLSAVQQGFMTDWTKLHDALFRNPKVVASLMAMAMAPPDPEP